MLWTTEEKPLKPGLCQARGQVLFQIELNNFGLASSIFSLLSVASLCSLSWIFDLYKCMQVPRIAQRGRQETMSRRVAPSRRVADSGNIPLISSLQQTSRSSPFLTVGLVLMGAFLIIGYTYSGSGAGSTSEKEALGRGEGISCTAEVQRTIPLLKKVYGDGMRKVLHVGPETCSVVSLLLKEETEAWGAEPYDLEDADNSCRSLVRMGIVRASDIKFPLPYRPKSFSVVIVSDSLDYLSPKYLNKTLPDLARVSADGLVIFAGYPGQQRAKVPELSKFGRPAKLRSYSWWIRYFIQTGLEENQSASKKFEQAVNKRSSYRPNCQVFHLKSFGRSK